MFVRKGRKRGAILNGKVEPVVLDRNLNLSQVNLVAPCLVEEDFLLFDVDTYLQDYPDVKDAYTKEKYALGQGKREIINKDLVYNHFLRFGRHEGRIAYGIKENGEKVRFTNFYHEDYIKVCEDAYNKGVNNEINGTLHYKKNEVKPKRIIVNEGANVFPNAFRNREFIKMLKREWQKFDTWKYKKAHGKNGSAKELFIDYISNHFEPLMAPIKEAERKEAERKEAERKLALQKEAERKVCIIYVYYEHKNETNSQTNLAYFIKYGLDQSRWRNMDITTLIMINGQQCELLIPEMKNVDVLPNENEYDIISYKKGIQYFEKKHNKPFYDIFNSLLIMNCGIFGPVYEEGPNRHWLDPFFNKLQTENVAICSPCINFLKDDDAGGPGPRCQSYCSLIKMDKTIYNLILNTILQGEYRLTRTLLENGYNISCLIYDNINYNDSNVWTHYSDRIDRIPDMTLSNFKSQVFVKNYWRINQELRDSLPCYYNESIQTAFSKTNMKNIYNDYPKIDYDYNLLDIHEKGYVHNQPNTKWVSKQDFYDKFGFAEEHILWPQQKSNNTACVIYCHYDKDNIVKDYVIQAVKTMIILEYDIFFCTTCTEIKNTTLPFKIHFFKNVGSGTDFIMANTIFNDEDLSKYKWINLLNDSILLPIHGIENMKNTIRTMRQGNDFWGLYESNEIQIHLCSNCFFEISAKCYPVLKSFYNSTLDKCTNKQSFIDNVEVRQTQYLVDNGFTYKGVVSYKELTPEPFCILFNPININKYLSDPKSFGIKWKYIGNYMDYKKLNNPYLNYLMRYLKITPNRIPYLLNMFDY